MHQHIGYRPLSAFTTQEIIDILKHDRPFAECLFPVSNSALFVQTLGFMLRDSIELVGLLYG